MENGETIRIRVNERSVCVRSGTRVGDLIERFRPGADVLIRKGAPVSADTLVEAGDEVVLIRRGEQPGPEEMEWLLTARHTPGVHEKVKAACVGIAGVGGLGSAVAVALARSGFGRLILADFDVVEPSNLNRQQYFVDQIGLPKVEALRENLRRIHPYVRVETQRVRLKAENLFEVFGDVDVLVEAFDRADAKAMLVNTARRERPGLPVVAASGVAGAHSSNTVVTRRMGPNFYLVGDGEHAARPGEGLMAPRVGVAAHHQANAVLRIVLGMPAG